MKRGALIFVLLFMTSNFCLLSAQENSPEDLDAILNKCAVYCEKLKRSALDLVCKEKVTQVIYYKSIRRKSRNKDEVVEKDWVYDYQLIRKNQKIKEQRILLQEDGNKWNLGKAKLDTRYFRHEFMILGPLSLIGEDKQSNHDYNIIGEEELWGNEVIIIEAVPKVEFTLDHLWGQIWLDKNDFSILKIKWNQESIEGQESLGQDVKIDITTEYSFEKSGIRFPSLYTLEASFMSMKWKKFVRTKIMVVYEDYKFFTVETEVRLK